MKKFKKIVPLLFHTFLIKKSEISQQILENVSEINVDAKTDVL